MAVDLRYYEVGWHIIEYHLLCKKHGLGLKIEQTAGVFCAAQWFKKIRPKNQWRHLDGHWMVVDLRYYGVTWVPKCTNTKQLTSWRGLDFFWSWPKMASELAQIWPKTKKKFTPIFFINQGCCQSLPCESTCFVAHRTSQKMRGIRNWKNCWKSIIPPLQSVAIPGPQKGLRAAFPGPAKENPLNTSLLIPPRCQKSTFQNFRFRTRPLLYRNPSIMKRLFEMLLPCLR